jgi:hypothetical protein
MVPRNLMAGALILGLSRTASPGGARVFFITPADGATVSNPIRIEFGIEGMAVVKVGNSRHDPPLVSNPITITVE